MHSLNLKVIAVLNNITQSFRVLAGGATDAEESLASKNKLLTEEVKLLSAQNFELADKLVLLQQHENAKDLQAYAVQFEALRKQATASLGEDFDGKDWIASLGRRLTALLAKESFINRLAEIVLKNELKVLDDAEVLEQLVLFLDLNKKRISDISPVKAKKWSLFRGKSL